MRALLALVLALAACSTPEQKAASPPLEPRVATAGNELLRFLPPGADAVAEVNLARLRANPVVGPVLAGLAHVQAAGITLADVDLVVAAAYHVGRDDAGTLIVARGRLGQVPEADPLGEDALAVGTPALRAQAVALAAGGASMAGDAAFLRLRDLAMPARAPGAALRLTARLDSTARVAAAGRLAVNQVPATFSVWLDVADDMALIALLGADDANGAARTASAVLEARGRVQRLVPGRLGRALDALTAEARGSSARVVWVVAPKAFAAWAHEAEKLMDWRVQPAAGPLAGEARVPGDKSIGHRAVLFAALCDGPCPVSGLSGGEDNLRTVAALRALGVRIDDGLTVHGVGLDGLRAAAGALDCGNSGTSMRLLAGLLAAQRFASELTGDEYLLRRPMRRVAEPLRAMGARVEGRPGARAGELYPPLVVGPADERLHGIRYASPVASAQVKSAVLLCGLYADGPTVVEEPGPSRDHTERMLASLGAPVSRPGPGLAAVNPGGWDRRLRARAFAVPGDPSSAAFLLAAALVAGGEARVPAVCVNPTRTGFLDVLAAMGARVEMQAARDESGEPVADLVAVAGDLHGVEIAGDVVVRAIDEIPVLAVVAARARGRTVVRDAAELRVKESDRIAATVRLLRGFGVEAHELDDGLVVEGVPGRPLRAADVDSAGDHRIAMSAAVAALGADGETIVRGVDNVATSFPGFADLIAQLGGDVRPSAPRL